VLNDVVLTQQLKTMRHEMVRGDLVFNRQLLQARDSAADVGINLEVAGEAKKGNLSAIVLANSRRVQEALRVIEEMAATVGVNLDSEKFKQARFNLYTIERVLLSRLLRRDKLENLTGLYAIIEGARLSGGGCSGNPWRGKNNSTTG